MIFYRSQVIRYAILIVIPMFSAAALAENKPKQIYFGDLHTHTNLSGDSVLVQVMQGIDRGPEHVCTYAQACAAVDFFGLSDHAEMVDKKGWDRSKQAVIDCNTKAASVTPKGADPEIVAFTGFEWTGNAAFKDKYWGHKNVFFRNDTVPEMPVGANVISELGVVDLKPLMGTLDVMKKYKVGLKKGVSSMIKGARLTSLKRCTDDTEQPCVRIANEPSGLFDILNSYSDDPAYVNAGYEALVIPHGSAWGMSKVGASWDIQLNSKQHDPNLQKIVEVFSGHGNSEEYRDFDDPKSKFESCRTRAGRLQWRHCRKEGESVGICKAQAVAAAKKTQVSFETTATDWGTCDQCTDCFQPAERYQPDGSIQAALAKSGFEDGATDPVRYHFGFIGSTDDHNARPASVMEKRRLTDWAMGRVFPTSVETKFAAKGRNAVEAERVGSYFYPGGLVAVHAESRTREAIWQSLQRREVYGTSGPRIQLWFNAVQDQQIYAMGSRVTSDTSPKFEVSVKGGPKELDGCSDATRQRWGDDVVENVCLDACYRPGRRVGIDRLEIIRIRPQNDPNEKIADLIDDPWRTIPNLDRQADGTVSSEMTAVFDDPEFESAKRDTVYYVRAVQAPTPAVNGVPMKRTAKGWDFCALDYHGDDCLSMAQERAWSSPIYVDAK